MFFWIIQITFISILLIFLVHYLLNFFTSTLTVPKIKDLVNNPAHKYENIYNVIANKNGDVKSDMKNELKNFLKKQLNVSSSTTEISTLDVVNGGVSYSDYSNF